MTYNPTTGDGKELQDLLEVICDAAHRFGIKTFEGGQLKVTFSDFQPKFVFPDPREISPIGEKYGMPTDDQMLFASSVPLTDDEIAARPPNG